MLKSYSGAVKAINCITHLFVTKFNEYIKVWG